MNDRLVEYITRNNGWKKLILFYLIKYFEEKG